MKRFHFNAAPDAALYARAIQKLQENKGIEDSPLFMTLETVSTHHPHIDPESGVNSEEKVFRYADQELGKFINNLNKQKFFYDGYVIIASDHRAMLPMRKNEFSLFGDEAFARVPFAVLGNKMKGEIKNAFSQTDLLLSLRYWISKDIHCINQNQGIFLPVNIHQPKCIYTRRSYNPDRVYLQCNNTKYTIQLDGDDRHYVGEQEGSAELLNQLHQLRLGKGF